MPPLTDREYHTLRYIELHIEKYGYSPTYEEIRRTQQVCYLRARQVVDRLCVKGYLARGPKGSWRTLRVLVPAQTAGRAA